MIELFVIELFDLLLGALVILGYLALCFASARAFNAKVRLDITRLVVPRLDALGWNRDRPVHALMLEPEALPRQQSCVWAWAVAGVAIGVGFVLFGL